MNHESFLEIFCRKSGNRSSMFYYPEEDRWIGAHHIQRQTGMTPKEYYLKYSGLDGKCAICGRDCNFEKLSRGFSATCSHSCTSRLSWVNNYESRSAATIKNLEPDLKWRDPHFVYKKNLGHFQNHESLKFYIVANEDFFKFGLSSENSGRVEHILEVLRGRLLFCKVMDRDLACRLEAEMYSLGIPYDSGLLENDGKLELRKITYLGEALKLIESC